MESQAREVQRSPPVFFETGGLLLFGGSMSPTFGLAFLDTTTKAEEGQWLTITNPLNGEPALFQGQPIQIKLAGPDSAHFNRVVAEMAASALADTSDEAIPRDAGEIKAVLTRKTGDECTLLAGLTLDWRNIPNANQQALPFSAELALQLYQHYPVVREQAYTFVNTRRNWLLEVQENLPNGHPANTGSNGMPKVTSEKPSHKSSRKGPQQS
jgi:hypothetical protein